MQEECLDFQLLPSWMLIAFLSSSQKSDGHGSFLTARTVASFMRNNYVFRASYRNLSIYIHPSIIFTTLSIKSRKGLSQFKLILGQRRGTPWPYIYMCVYLYICITIKCLRPAVFFLSYLFEVRWNNAQTTSNQAQRTSKYVCQYTRSVSTALFLKNIIAAKGKIMTGVTEIAKMLCELGLYLIPCAFVNKLKR